jgi:hypothetical protein
VLTVHDDQQEGEALLRPVLRGGKRKRLDGAVPLSASRDHAAHQLRSLPERLRTLNQARKPFKIKISGPLQYWHSPLTSRGGATSDIFRLRGPVGQIRNIEASDFLPFQMVVVPLT